MTHNEQMPSSAPNSSLAPDIAHRLKRDDHGLFAAVAQQWDSGEVLMVGWMDDEALHRTLTTGRVTYFSRSRGEYWRKGDTSGHVQLVREVHLLPQEGRLRRGWPNLSVSPFVIRAGYLGDRWLETVSWPASKQVRSPV